MYDTFQESIDSGQPVRAYQFARGPIFWRYTTADIDVVIDFKTFHTGYQISDDGIQMTSQVDADALTVSLSASAPVRDAFNILAPADPVILTVWDYHHLDNDFVISWIGLVQSWRLVDRIKLEITCRLVSASLDKPGLLRAWTRGCSHSLYDTVGCKVDPLEYEEVGQVVYLDRQAIRVAEVDEYPDDWFTGGFVYVELETNVYEFRGIRRHIGDTLLLLGGTSRMALNDVCRIYPGCSRTASVCDTKFLNLPNYGGIPQLMGRTIYNGASLW